MPDTWISVPIDTDEQYAWRNLRFPLAWAPAEANVARIVADVVAAFRKK